MPILDNLQPIICERISVGELLTSPDQRLPLHLVNGTTGIGNQITERNLHRPQLALAGYVELFTYHRVQIFGNTEVYYLKSLTLQQRIDAFANIARFSVPCIIVANNHTLDSELMDIATQNNIAVLSTPWETTKVLYYLSEFLELHFAPRAVLHGSFMDVYGVGIMFMGRSGIGKSEVALDLVERGHRLVADDVVMLIRKHEDILLGMGTSMVNHFMEIRGLGIIDIRQMFGVRAIRFQKRLEIIVELEEWNPDTEYTRTGLDRQTISLLGTNVTFVKLPILPGKNITVIAEVIALNYLLHLYGYDAAKELSDKLREKIEQKSRRGSKYSDGPVFPYFSHDDE